MEPSNEMADQLRAHFAGLPYRKYLERRDLLQQQIQKILYREHRARIRQRLAKAILPWAGLLTILRYSNSISRFLDRLIILSDAMTPQEEEATVVK